MVLLVLFGLVLAFVGRRGTRARSRRLIELSGLGGEPDPERTLRDQVIEAAGFARRPEAAPARSRGWAVLLMGSVLAGGGWGSLNLAPRALGPLESRYVEFRGTAASDSKRFDWGAAVEANVDSVILDGRVAHVDLRAWLSGLDGEVSISAGERLTGQGRLEPVGDAGFDEYLRSRGIEAMVHTSSFEVREGGQSIPLAAADAARRVLREGLDAAMAERAEGLLLGLSIGDTSKLHPEIEEDFRASGLSHLLAVSGSNVATFLAPVLLLTARFGVRPRARSFVGALAVVFFALITRWEPSVLRASAMACIVLIGLASGRPRSTAPALGAAVLILLVADPGLSTSVGFELSVAATAGIAWLAGPIASRLRALPRPVALAVAATVAAQVAVTPLLLVRFGIVPVVTLLANVVAFPAVAPALLIGVSAALVTQLLPPLGALLGSIAELPLGYLMGVADRSARMPLPSLTSETWVMPAAAALLAGLLLLTLRSHRRWVVAVATVVVSAAAWAVPLRSAPTELSAIFLDVGQGDAALVRSPAGATILIDAGPEEDQVAVDLARLGVKRIDLAIATHAHADHIAGFPAVLARFPISVLLEPGCPADSPVYADFLRASRYEDVRVEHPRGGERFTAGDVVVEILAPDGCSALGEPNDDSIVTRVSVGDDSFLFTGDAEVPSQLDMLEDADPLAADVLKVPHHGGDTSDPSFLAASGSSVAIVSVGENTYGHPTEAVLQTLRSSGMVVYRTDVHGELTVRFTAAGTVAVGSVTG